MTAEEMLEQVFTRRPNAFVLARTRERLPRLPRKPDAERLWLNWAMCCDHGIVLGVVRGLMAARGLRNPTGALLFTNLSLLNDETLENATGAGSPPWTWPVGEQVIDVRHKAVDAVIGAVAARLVAGPPDVPRPRLSQAERRP